MDFPVILKDLREQRGFTQEQLADALHLSKNSISHYEKGLNMPNTETLITIANIFDVSVDYLLGRVSIKTPYSKLKDKISKDIRIDDFINDIISLDNAHRNDLLSLLEYIKFHNDFSRNKKNSK